MSAPELTLPALLAAFVLLAIPIAFSLRFRLGIVRELLVAALRMTVQLAAAGLLLTYLFRVDNPWLNLLWLGVMMLVAAITTVQKSQLDLRRILPPVCAATFAATLAITLYFNAFVVRIDEIFEARFLVVIGGMVLGNVLAGNIVSMTHFYNSLRDREERYLYFLGNGATRAEALRPFFREAMVRGLKPALAGMATIGIVALPGMMTGQMLGGATPIVAIQYQIAIMLAIFSTQVLGMSLGILFTNRNAFDDYGMLRQQIFG
jgi:putative ABC transport system permease protein